MYTRKNFTKFTHFASDLVNSKNKTCKKNLIRQNRGRSSSPCSYFNCWLHQHIT
uniref:Uncharacterized protein n=1 Tax=Octopus bimaculoides TaxID=37653 RepID=A0A0L8H4R9_OCTBM